MGLVRLAAPAAPLVSLDEARLHLRVDRFEESALITALVEAAIDTVVCRSRR